ncbi:MAG: hypothetical protein DID90_2727553587 [Candidatus Nitrotoga sp. LAW]|nr:MAG: hypothetical protein DID90_2727553587 [Candidatus Nitrotoga sp. LAW]
MKKIVLVAALSALISPSFAQGSLENPVAGSTESGIGVISGWHCTASNITVTIDGASLGKAGSGTSRGDTADICGRSNTGYSLLYNYNDLPSGSHNLGLYADGELLETRQFNTTQSAGAPFVTGISKTATVADFPTSGRMATLLWSQAKQSFVVVGLSPAPSTAPAPPPGVLTDKERSLEMVGTWTFYTADKQTLLASYSINGSGIRESSEYGWYLMGKNIYPYAGFPLSSVGTAVQAGYNPAASQYYIIDASAEKGFIWGFLFDSEGVESCYYRYAIGADRGSCIPFWGRSGGV